MINIAFPNGKHNQIMVIDGLIDPSQCDQLMKFLKPIYDQVASQGETMGGINVKYKCSYDSVLSETFFSEKHVDYPQEIQTIENDFVKNLTSAVELYKQEYLGLFDWDLIQDTGFQVQKYLRGQGFYRPHVDSFPATESSNRVAAAIFYLNTVKQGGETRFPLHDISVAPRKGRLVMFPATWTHLHEGRLPITDDKWIINTFLINVPAERPHDHPHGDHDH